MKAALHAAADARRLGHTDPLAIAFLRAATEGYLDEHQWRQLPRTQRDTWFDDALAYLEKPCKGTPGPLTPTREVSGAHSPERLEIADYLEHHLERTRRSNASPVSLWNAAESLITEAATLRALAEAARRRGRRHHALRLFSRAHGAGDVSALLDIAWLRDQQATARVRRRQPPSTPPKPATPTRPPNTPPKAATRRRSSASSQRGGMSRCVETLRHECNESWQRRALGRETLSGSKARSRHCLSVTSSPNCLPPLSWRPARQKPPSSKPRTPA